MHESKQGAAEIMLDSSAQLATRGNGFMRRLVLRKLSQIENGLLIADEDGQQLSFGQKNQSCEIQANLEIKDASVYGDIVRGGSVAAAEGYINGKWTTTDLTSVIRIFAANPVVLGDLNGGSARMLLPLLRAAHRLNRNSTSQSRRNIARHYDLGNEFFKTFLDPTLSYSSAIYPEDNSTLTEAAIHKFDVVCKKLQLTPEDHVLEIGTGWGGLALHAASQYGCRVTTTTISKEQHEYARQLIQKAGMQDRITLLREDYRALEGKYDKLVSIEMIEAVGHEYLNGFIKICSARLHNHGRALIQAILMPDHDFDDYKKSVDFIQKYIFPGGALPSLSAITMAVRQHSDLSFNSLHDISLDYAHTLRDWRHAFLSHSEKIRELGYPEEFIRMWEYYFCYCEGGFTERIITTAQLVFDKPGCRLPVDIRPVTPLTH
jgi:cyclopropane-fatty-acyl-phospholipid synthase